MNQDQLDQLLKLLSGPSELVLESNGQTDSLVLKLPDCSQDDLELFQAVIEQAKLGEQPDAFDYTAYFDAITGSPLYKPGNPVLAILQVAKTYNLDAGVLKQSFKAFKGG